MGPVGPAHPVHLHGHRASGPRHQRRPQGRERRRGAGVRRGLCHRVGGGARRHAQHQAARRKHILLPGSKYLPSRS